MVKFFRRIRRKLLAEGNLQRYGLYAMGEIMLVVVGILIAFQINSWSDNSKARKKEKQHLINLKNEIGQSVIRMDEALAFQNLTLDHIENIIEHVDNDLPYSVSLDTSFQVYQYFAIPELSLTTYETIKALGINAINPDDLRFSLTKLYEEDFDFLANSIKETERSFYQNVLTGFHVKHLRETSYLGVSKPNDYEALKKNQEYINILYKLKGLRLFTTNALASTQKKASDVLSLLDERLEDF